MRRTRLNAFWLFLIFVVVEEGLSGVIGEGVFKYVYSAKFLPWRPTPFIVFEGISAFALLVASILVAKLQKRRLAEIGYDARRFGGETLSGAIWGLGTVVVLVTAIATLGGFSFGSLALHGSQLGSYTLMWLLAFIGVGVAEEMTFRGPALILLGEAIGFWPAAIVTSLIFGGLHYFFKQGETIADGLSVTLIGFFLCYTVRVTGSIWWAVAFHALFDYAAIFLFGAPNSGNNGHPIDSKLLTGGYHGAQWLTGGPLGVEASWLVFPLIAILFLYMRFRGYHAAVQTEGGAA